MNAFSQLAEGESLQEELLSKQSCNAHDTMTALDILQGHVTGTWDILEHEGHCDLSITNFGWACSETMGSQF